MRTPLTVALSLFVIAACGSNGGGSSTPDAKLGKALSSAELYR